MTSYLDFPERGMSVNVFRPANGSDCTNGGASSTHDKLWVIKADAPVPENAPYPVFRAVSHGPGICRLVPVEIDNGGWPMFGGNFANCSDGRVCRLFQELTGFPQFYGAVAIHDRQE